MGSRYFQRPENAISKADEFIKVREAASAKIEQNCENWCGKNLGVISGNMFRD